MANLFKCGSSGGKPVTGTAELSVDTSTDPNGYPCVEVNLGFKPSVLTIIGSDSYIYYTSVSASSTASYKYTGYYDRVVCQYCNGALTNASTRTTYDHARSTNYVTTISSPSVETIAFELGTNVILTDTGFKIISPVKFISRGVKYQSGGYVLQTAANVALPIEYMAIK